MKKGALPQGLGNAKILFMKIHTPLPLDLKKVDAKLRQWQKRHDTPAKVAAAHRKVILDRVVQSMAFENEPVSTARLKTLTVVGL